MIIKYHDTVQVKAKPKTRKKFDAVLRLVATEKGCELSKAAALDLLMQCLNPAAVRKLLKEYAAAMLALEAPKKVKVKKKELVDA